MNKIIYSMGNLCQFGCGCMLEYESHEFSDGFVYKIPRESENKIHHCIIPGIFYDLYLNGLEVSDWSEFYGAVKNELCISEGEFKQLIDNGMKDPTPYLGQTELWHFMGLLRHGKMDELIQSHQLEITKLTLPSKKYREYLPSQNEPVQSNRDGVSLTLATKLFFKENENSIHPDDMCNTIPVILPTDKGYQLEYLGYCYELMMKFRDAKKCYDLQHQFTEEPELLEKSHELEKKIKRQNHIQKSISNLTIERVRKEAEQTELNLRQYILKLFSDDLKKLFKKDPKLREQVQNRRNENRDSMLELEEGSDMDLLHFGNLIHILKISHTRKRAWFDGKCKKCGKTWSKKQEFFHEKNKIQINGDDKTIQINCVDETCFKKQGGLYKDVKQEMIDRGDRVRIFRNKKDHILKAQDPVGLQRYLRETFETCNFMNWYIEDFLVKNQST
ncbi:hypothetical protein OAL59_01955 [Nitrosopumilus sp.]|nr:hypothetical protein [Nitrosopumilus sp.]